MILSLVVGTILMVCLGACVLIWILGNVKNELIQTGAIIIYGFSFIWFMGRLFVEVILKSL